MEYCLFLRQVLFSCLFPDKQIVQSPLLEHLNISISEVLVDFGYANVPCSTQCKSPKDITPTKEFLLFFSGVFGFHSPIQHTVVRLSTDMSTSALSSSHIEQLLPRLPVPLIIYVFGVVRGWDIYNEKTRTNGIRKWENSFPELDLSSIVLIYPPHAQFMLECNLSNVMGSSSCLSCSIFSQFSAFKISYALDLESIGMNINGEDHTHLQFADNIVLIADRIDHAMP